MIINNIIPSTMSKLFFNSMYSLMIDGLECKLKNGSDSVAYLNKKKFLSEAIAIDSVVRATLEYYETKHGVYSISDLRYKIKTEFSLCSDRVIANYSKGFYYITFESLYVVSVKDSKNKLKKYLEGSRIKQIRIFNNFSSMEVSKYDVNN